MKFPCIKLGMAAERRYTVLQSDTRGNHLPEEISSLLSSPALASMMIETSVGLIDQQLPAGFVSVGKSVSVVHEHPSVVGDHIIVRVEVVEFDGYHISIAMEVHDDSGLCGTGSHVRSIVNQRWLELKIARRVAAV